MFKKHLFLLSIPLLSVSSASATLTCTAYDPTGSSAIGACSDFGQAFTYRGETTIFARFASTQHFASWGFSSEAGINLQNNLRPSAFPKPDGSPDDPQYLAQAIISDHVKGEAYYMIRGGTGLAEVRFQRDMIWSDSCCHCCDGEQSKQITLNYEFPREFSSGLYPYNTPFRFSWDMSAQITTGKQGPGAIWSYGSGLWTSASLMVLNNPDAYIEVVPEPRLSVIVGALLVVVIALRRARMRSA